MNFIAKGEKNVRLDTTVSKDDGASSRFGMSKMCDWSCVTGQCLALAVPLMTTSGRLSSESLPCFPWPLFYLSNQFQVRIRSHPANSEAVIFFERGNPIRAFMPFEQNVRLVTARSEQRLQARGMRTLRHSTRRSLARAHAHACEVIETLVFIDGYE